MDLRSARRLGKFQKPSTQTLHHAFSIPAPDAGWMLHIEIWRTVLFMLMIVRFYVGAVVFFWGVFTDLLHPKPKTTII